MEREDEGVKEGGEDDIRGQPPSDTASYRVGSKDRYMEERKIKAVLLRS